MMTSAPVPDWIAEVMRDCRSLALTVSTLRVMPNAFLHSCVIGPLSSTSEAGTKSAQRSQWTAISWARAGPRPLARIAAIPPDAESFRTLRRAIRAMISSHPFSCRAVAPHDPATPPRTASGVGLDAFAVGPLGRLLGRHALDRLGVHVDDDVLADHLGRLAVGRPGIACQPAEHRQVLERLQHRIDVPHGMLLPHMGSAGGVALLRDEPLIVDRLCVEPAPDIPPP